MLFPSWYSLLCVLLLQEGNINALISWPDGSYGLLQPNTGCPTGRGWYEDAWIFQYISVKYGLSKFLHIKGEVFAASVKRYFCIRNLHSGTAAKRWPKGQYCIYHKYRMQEMQRGQIEICDERYHNIKDFVQPEYNYYYIYYYKSWSRCITIHFACQTNGNKKIPIELPITKPFYLLPYGSRDCQQVYWMVATREWIKYYTRNYERYRNHQTSGTVPHHKLGGTSGNREITMYYCYYQSCNHTLTNKTGVFQSPRFPDKYPDGQLCSWRIMVPANHTLHVRFTNFSLYEYDEDCLQLHKNTKGHFKLKQAFFGRQEPFNISASSDLLFVFRSDEENNSNGFKAQYEILRIPERTTTASPKPTTTTAPPTTQKPTTTSRPTTKLITTKPPTTKPPTTKAPTTKQVTTNKATTFTNNSTTSQDTPTTTNYESSHDRNVQTIVKETSFCDETWKTVVIVSPLVFFILIVVVVVDLLYRCRSRKSSKSGTSESVDDGIVINPTYERGDIVLGHPTNTTAENDSTADTVDDKPLSPDELPDYEDVDYTQLNEMKPPNMETRYPECHALEPVGRDAPEVFYHVLEPPTDLNRPTYQNLSEMNHYTLNPIYDSSAQNPAPLLDENKLYVQYSTT